jgi:hypothetical protein
MASKAQQRKWLDAAKAIASGIDDSALPLCPACAQRAVDYLYVGDPATRIGFLVIWCHACLRGVHISRTRTPANVHFMTFEDAKTAIAQRVPTFTEVPLHS